jgi:predicted acyltransferase
MKSSRLLSLDVFRGITIAFMILVNMPGSWSYVYAPLRHSQWDGVTPTDIIFPTFLFIVGISMWYSLRRYDFKISTRSVTKIIVRSLVIFLAGLFLNLFPFIGIDLSTIRIMGVLQRIALAYGFSAIIALLVDRKYIWIVFIAILGGYNGAMVLFGGSTPFSLEGNLVLRIDKFILGQNHLYNGFGIPFDPEGLFSTIPAIGTVLMGYLAGDLVGKGKANGVNSLKMIIYGITSIVASLIISVLIPINKPLWSSSYVLFSGGVSLIVFSIIYLVIDVSGIRFWTPVFKVFGINSLFIYLLSGIWTKTLLLISIGSGDTQVTLYSWIYSSIFAPVLGNLNGSLAFAFMQVVILWIPGYFLYRKNIVLKV